MIFSQDSSLKGLTIFMLSIINCDNTLDILGTLLLISIESV